MRLIDRLRAAIAALRNPGTLVVIYDLIGREGDESEQYYGYFDTREEALKLFNTAFPEGKAHNAYLCRTVECLRPHRED